MVMQRRVDPVALGVTTVAPSSESAVSPCRRSSQPEPDPRVSPATPVGDTRPPVTASPCAWVAASSSFQVSPAPARTVRAARSTSVACAISAGRRSIAPLKTARAVS